MKKILNILTLILIAILIMSSITLANTGTVTDSDFLNVRESPSTSSNIVTVLPENASFDILEDQGDWYKIKYQDYTGYVSKQYVSVSENTINSSLPAKANAEGIVNKNSKIYVLPLLNSTVMGTVNSSTKVLVVSIAGKWAYIQTDTISGWVFTDNINGTDETNTADTNNSDNNENNSGVNNNEVDNNNVDDQNVDSNNDNDNKDNTANTNNNSNENNSSYPKTMYVNVDAVYIRAKISTESDIVASVGLNTPVTVNGEEGDWYKVNVTDGSGYMMKKYLSETKQ